MPSSKLQNRTIPTKRSKDVKQKGNQPKNVKQKTSKTPQPTYDENQKKRTSPNPKHGKAVEVEIGYHEEEELGSNLEPTEIQGSEDSSDEPEASNIQSDKQQSVNKESVEEEPRRGAFPVQAATSPKDDKDKEENDKGKDQEKAKEDAKTEEKNGKNEADATEIVSDGNENELIKKDTKIFKKSGGQCGQCLNPSETKKETKYKMFKRSMTKQQADKEERPRANTEKHKLAKEAKQKAKGKKKKEERGDEPSPATGEGQPSKDFFHSNLVSPNGKNRLLKKTKFVKERDSVVVDDSDEEKEEGEPITTKSITDQSPTSLLKINRKDLKVTPEPDEQRDVKSVIKEKPQSLLLNKVRMASLGHTADKRRIKSNEDILECDGTEVAPSKVIKPVIAQHKKATALRRVSGWIQKKVPQQLNFKKKLSILTKAIGVSHWLSSRAIKQKHGTRKTKGNLFKHRMAVRVASRTSLTNVKYKNSSENKGGNDKPNLQGKTKEIAGKVLQGEDKDLEAKFAVVLPRMNETSKAKIDEKPSPALGSSTSPCPAGELGVTESKTPKPGAKLVLPVKPDLSLLKSTRKLSREGFMADTDVIKRMTGSLGTSEDLFKLEGKTKKVTMENQDGISMLQAARGKLKPSQINLSKLPMGKIGNGQTQLKRPDTGREEAAGTPRSIAKHVPSKDTRATISAVCPLYEEETDIEVAQFMGEAGLYMISQPEVHWSGNSRMSGNPQVCVVNLVLSSWLNESNLSILSHLSDKPAKYHKRESYESQYVSQHFAPFGTGLAPVRKPPATSDGGEANQVDSL